MHEADTDVDGYDLPLSTPHSDLDGMDKLCRPEAVIQQSKGGKNYLVVLSEDSGAECANAPFSFIRAEIMPTEQRCKDRQDGRSRSGAKSARARIGPRYSTTTR